MRAALPRREGNGREEEELRRSRASEREYKRLNVYYACVAEYVAARAV